MSATSHADGRTVQRPARRDGPQQEERVASGRMDAQARISAASALRASTRAIEVDLGELERHEIQPKHLIEIASSEDDPHLDVCAVSDTATAGRTLTNIGTSPAPIVGLEPPSLDLAAFGEAP